MTELFEAFRQQFKDRLTSPLSGAFAVSWAVINYQFFLVVFSDLKPWVKIGFIKNQIFPDATAVAIYGVMAPLGAALAYILVYPHPARWALKYSLSQKRLAKEARHDAENLMPMTREDVDAEILPLRAKIGNLQTEIDRKDATIDRAKQTKERDEDLLGQLAKKLENAIAEKALMDKTVRDLQSKLTDKESEAAKNKSQLQDLERTFASFSVQTEDEAASLKNEIANLRNSLEAANEQLAASKEKSLETTHPEWLANSTAKINSLSQGHSLGNQSAAILEAARGLQDFASLDQTYPPGAVELASLAAQQGLNERVSSEALAALQHVYETSKWKRE